MTGSHYDTTDLALIHIFAWVLLIHTSRVKLKGIKQDLINLTITQILMAIEQDMLIKQR